MSDLLLPSLQIFLDMMKILSQLEGRNTIELASDPGSYGAVATFYTPGETIGDI